MLALTLGVVFRHFIQSGMTRPKQLADVLAEKFEFFPYDPQRVNRYARRSFGQALKECLGCRNGGAEGRSIFPPRRVVFARLKLVLV